MVQPGTSAAGFLKRGGGKAGLFFVHLSALRFLVMSLLGASYEAAPESMSSMFPALHSRYCTSFICSLTIQ